MVCCPTPPSNRPALFHLISFDFIPHSASPTRCCTLCCTAASGIFVQIGARTKKWQMEKSETRREKTPSKRGAFTQYHTQFTWWWWWWWQRYRSLWSPVSIPPLPKLVHKPLFLCSTHTPLFVVSITTLTRNVLTVA